jgi:hypothetical protein
MAFGVVPRFAPSFSRREVALAARALVSPGDEAARVRAFEQAFAELIGAPHAVMVPSARLGFYLVLEAWGLGPGDEVVLPSLTYFAIPAFAKTLGCTPVFADIHPTSHTLDPESFRAAITPRTRAVVPTHLFGTPADLDPILAVAREHGIRVVEDCAQATGARYGSRRVGSLGDAAFYTFGLTKNITTLKGAMVTTSDPVVADHARAWVERASPQDLGPLLKEVATGAAMRLATHPLVYPWTLHPVVRVGNALGDDPIHDRFGEAHGVPASLPAGYARQRPRGLQADVGLAQLARLDDLNGARVRNGRFLDEHLAHVPGLTRPTWPDKAWPIFMSYVVHHERRDDLATRLRARGIDTTVGYMSDCAHEALFADHEAPCPNAAEAARTLLHLPVHPHLSERDLHHMVEAVRLACHELDA